VIANLCVFGMGARGRRRGQGRKRPFGCFKTLKNNDLASLLFVLIWSCLLLFGRILRYFRLCGLVWPYEAV